MARHKSRDAAALQPLLESSIVDGAQLTPVASAGLASVSSRMSSFSPSLSSGPGMYCASWGPMLAQYLRKPHFMA